MSFEVGDIVEYKKSYGKGIVVAVKGTNVRVRFPRFSNFEMVSSETSFKLLKKADGTPRHSTTPIENKPAESLRVGSIVEHSHFGRGKVLSIHEDVASVAFADKVRMMAVSYLTLVIKREEPKVAEEVPVSEEDRIVIIPSNFSDQPFPTKVKMFMNWLRRHYTTGVASAKCFASQDNVKATTGFLLEPRKGVVVYKLFETDDPNAVIGLLRTGILDRLYKDERKAFYDHFLESKKLCVFHENGTKQLSFPLFYVFIFPGIDLTPELMKALKEQKELANVCFFAGYTNHVGTGFFTNPLPYDAKFTAIPKSLYGNVVERVIPEYVTLFIQNQKQYHAPGRQWVSSSADKSFTPITGNEKEFEALDLDDDQIRTINETRSGHQLYLANPGTGKSVLLLSKAYRFVSMNKNSSVWVTCYNKNLAKKHLNFSEISGLNKTGLVVHTFYDEAFFLLNKYSFKDTQRIELMTNDDQKYAFVVERLLSLLQSKDIPPLFDAIFIDEVQLLDPLWLKACHMLLKENGVFELYGDLNQDVRYNKARRLASWQSKELGLNWQGRTRYLSKNYRNTAIINNYIRQMLFGFNRRIDTLGANQSNMEAVAKEATSTRPGKHKVIITAATPYNVCTKVKAAVQYIKQEWGADYNDIAVLFPASRLTVRSRCDYHLLDSLQQTLSNARIPSSVIFGRDAVPLPQTSGVVLSTIDSALGLDFKFVILTGTFYWTYYWNETHQRTACHFSKASLAHKSSPDYDAGVAHFMRAGRKLYSACSRAREGLIIIDDSNELTPFSELYTPEGGEDYYEKK